MSNDLFANTKSVQNFSESIGKRLASANRSWLLVARVFAEAEAVLERSDFKKLLKLTRFAYSTVRKLIKIANSDRIKQYEKKLVLIDAWSTLHEIVKLNDEKFVEFAKSHLSGDEPTYFKRSDVERMKLDFSVKPERKFPVFATVRVNIDVDNPYENFELIKKEIETLAKSVEGNSLVTIDVVDLESRLEKRYQAEMNKVVKDIKHEKKIKLREIVKTEKAKLPRRNRKKAFETSWGISEEEIFAADPNEMIEFFGHERIAA